MNMKEIINTNTCRNFIEYAKLEFKHDIVFLGAYEYIC